MKSYRLIFICVAAGIVFPEVLPTVFGSEVASTIQRVVAFAGAAFFIGLAILNVRRKAKWLISLAAILIGVGLILFALDYTAAGIVAAAAGIVLAAVAEWRQPVKLEF